MHEEQRFPTPVFRAHLDMLESIRSELIADVLELVATDPLPDVPGQPGSATRTGQHPERRFSRRQ